MTLNVSMAAPGLDIEALKDLVKQEDIRTVDRFIEALPTEYLDNYTLVYDSLSLQEGSKRNPRAILFGTDAKLVMTFNGDSSHAQYQAVEVMQFREDIDAFELMSVKFDGSRAEFSEPNPEVCKSCHGDPGQPIWSSYEYDSEHAVHWPGAYGSVHDAPQLNQQEAEAFRQYQVNAKEHARYGKLKTQSRFSEWYPYGKGPLQHRLRPNNRLGNLLARWQARYLVARIQKSNFFDLHPDLVAAWLLQCPETRTEAFTKTVRELYRSYAEAAGGYEWLSIEPGPYQVDFMMQTMLTDANYRHWNMDLQTDGPGQYYFTGIVNLSQLVTAHWMQSLPPEHKLKQYYEPWSSADLYDTFAEGYYDGNVKPGGVGESYDRVALYYDPELGQQGCAQLNPGF